MPGKHKYDLRNHQTTWEDVEYWAESLQEDHNVVFTAEVVVLHAKYGLQPAVRVKFFKLDGKGTQVLQHEDWRTFSLRSVGEVEKWVLHMASMHQLTLDNDKALAERSELPLFQ